MIGWKVVEWDQRQLRHIAEIARACPWKARPPWPRIFGGGGSKTGGAGPGGSQGPNRSVFFAPPTRASIGPCDGSTA